MSAEIPTTSDEDFSARVTALNDIAKHCADETVYRAELTGEDRNTVLRAIIIRLQDAINAKR